MFMYKVKHALLPMCCLQYFALNNVMLNFHNTRKPNYFIHPAFRTDIRQQCVVVSGPRLWDSLPREFDSINSVYILRKRL